MSRYIYVSLALLVTIYFGALYLGAFDYFNLRKNHFRLDLKMSSKNELYVKKEVVILYTSFGDTTFLYKDGVSLGYIMDDWYGKDYLSLAINKDVFKYYFLDYKTNFWEKVTCNIELYDNQGLQEVYIKSNLETLWNSVTRIDTLSFSSQ